CVMLHSFFLGLAVLLFASFFFFPCPPVYRYLHSFPTRRSSDLPGKSSTPRPGRLIPAPRSARAATTSPPCRCHRSRSAAATTPEAGGLAVPPGGGGVVGRGRQPHAARTAPDAACGLIRATRSCESPIPNPQSPLSPNLRDPVLQVVVVGDPGDAPIADVEERAAGQHVGLAVGRGEAFVVLQVLAVDHVFGRGAGAVGGGHHHDVLQPLAVAG